MGLPLADAQQTVTDRKRVAHLDADGGDGAGLERTDLGFHFHGFENHHQIALLDQLSGLQQHFEYVARQRRRLGFTTGRSEEHTSELQSLMQSTYAVFCLKKKTKHKNSTNRHIMTRQSISRNNINTM